MIEPAFVATKTLTSNELPPHPLRNWIITAFCKWITAKNPLTCQNHTFYSAVLFKCLDGVLRARRRVLAVRSCHRGNIELISPNHLYQDLLNQGGVTVIDFWAPWCGYCRRIAPTLEKVAEQREGDLVVAKINADEEPELLRKNGVELLPTLKLFRNGESKGQIVAPGTKAEIDAFIQESLGG